VPVKLCIHSGVPHGFVFATELDCTKRYFDAMVEWMDNILKINIE
jgi:hypothetical protein